MSSDPTPPPRTLLRRVLESVQREAIPSHSVHRALRKAWSEVGSSLAAAAQTKRLSILAIGKASPTMLRSVDELLRERGVVLTRERVFLAGPEGLLDGSAVDGGLATNPHRSLRDIAGVCFGVDHPIPTPRNVGAALACEAWLGELPREHLLLVLLSGGVSAQLALPIDGVGLEDLASVTSALLRAGATIEELNCVRKHLERLKGGRMAGACSAHRALVLAMSDCLGDDPTTIASGPFSPDPTTAAQALGVLERYGVLGISEATRRTLEATAQNAALETPKHASDLGIDVDYRVIASNAGVVRAGARMLERLGITTLVLDEPLRGRVQDVASQLLRRLDEHETGHGVRPWALVAGGEWTVDARDGQGVGGPSQELALRLLAAGIEAGVLAYSTDGGDGPTEYAGAVVVGPGDLAVLQELGVDVQDAIDRHDSSRALRACGALLRTGPTGTNLNHVVCVLRT